MNTVNKGKKIGICDSFGTPIRDGDTILWTYQSAGVVVDGKFMGCYPGNEIREMSKEQVMKYEVRQNSAGYFLDVPNGCGVMFLKETIKCKVIKNGAE